MIIETKELNSKHKNTILADMLLNSPRDIMDEVLLTIDHLEGDDRIIDVKVLFNGIEHDGQILEDLLQTQWKYRCKTLDEKYTDVEKLATQKAEVLFQARLRDLKEPTLEKLRKIASVVDQLQLELDCL